MRRWPTISWEEISHQKPNPAGLDLGLPASTTMKNKFLSHPVCGILSQQPKLRHHPTLNYSPPNGHYIGCAFVCLLL